MQQGLLPTDRKPIVLHAFEKRSRRTPQPEIELARTRLADLLRHRAQKPEGQ
ncbi:MAG: type II toxin-antitoxin system RelE/ParE family toxin [Vicinamibacterales bacterium]